MRNAYKNSLKLMIISVVYKTAKIFLVIRLRNYTMKKFIFFSLLVMATVTNCVEDIDLHKNSQNDVLFNKLQELSELSTKIAEKEALINALDEQASALYDTALEDSLNRFVQKFEKTFHEKEDMKGIIVEGLAA